MQFTSYSDFRTKFQQMFDGDDISRSDMSVAILDLIIATGERRIYRDVRSSAQDTALSLTITSNVATLPADFIELKLGPYVGTFVTAIYAPPEAVNNQIQIGADTANHPVYYTFQGDSIIFYPSQATGATVSGRYYKKFTDIATGGLNAFFTRHPDLFLYAALAESGPFLGETSRTSVWESKYVNLAQSVNEEERRRITRGSKLTTRIA